ncbi:MAG: hypothetical protein JOY54_01895 [Acidobacteriaceae bacterium]|nr:hypothetical protein [Acidobacteriaceae bacterium]
MKPDHLADEHLSPRHLSKAVLIRAMDNELSGAEATAARVHLAVCDECSRACEEWRHLSYEIASMVASVPAALSAADGEQFMQRMEARAAARPAVHTHRQQSPTVVLRRFGWGVAIAATLALGVMLAPHGKEKLVAHEPAAVAMQSGTIEVDGESFIPLSYSNPDLPVNTSRVVQMRVPVSSLTEAGIVFEPISNGSSTADRTVLADVLIGTDGQPLGVHILGLE